MIKKLTTIFLTISMSNSFAQKLPHWEDYMADHEFKGCPQHSTCTQEMGERFLALEAALKTKKLSSFFNKLGIPITGRRHKNQAAKKNQFAAIWDSPCNYKKEKKSSFERITTFSKKIKGPDINYPTYYLINSKNELTLIPASSDDSALGVHKNRLVFNRIYKKNYYQYQVGQNGQIFIENDINMTQFSEYARCKKEHLDIISNHLTKQELTQVNCRNIYDKKGQKSYLFYLPRCE